MAKCHHTDGLAAALIFRRFAQGYDVFLDNCQLFCQLLAETVGGKDNVEQVRKAMEKKSVMKLPLAASWMAGPAYHFMATVQHSLPKDDEKSRHSCEGNSFCLDCAAISLSERIGYTLENWEKFYYHPRLYASRKKTIKGIDDFMEKIGF